MDYIERDVVVALFEEKQKALCPLGRCSRNMVYGADRELYDAIDSDIDTVLSIPSADVVKVKHGRWKWKRLGCVECSLCHKENNIRKFPYCPHCGAKMNGE
jgi:hypothetical protein